MKPWKLYVGFSLLSVILAGGVARLLGEALPHPILFGLIGMSGSFMGFAVMELLMRGEDNTEATPK